MTPTLLCVFGVLHPLVLKVAANSSEDLKTSQWLATGYKGSGYDAISILTCGVGIVVLVGLFAYMIRFVNRQLLKNPQSIV